MGKLGLVICLFVLSLGLPSAHGTAPDLRTPQAQVAESQVATAPARPGAGRKSPEEQIAEWEAELAKVQKQIHVYQDLMKKLDSPQLRFLMAILGDEAVRTHFAKVAEKWNATAMMWIQVLLFFSFIVFRAYTANLLKAWYERVFLSLLSSVLYIIMAAVIIPWTILGRPYLEFLVALYLAAKNVKY